MSYLEMSEDEICNHIDKTSVHGLEDLAFSLYEEAQEEIDKLKRDIKDIEREYLNNQTSYNAVISYILGKGYTESPMEFLRCWNEGNFEALREEWPDAPEEIYLADILYKGETK